MGRAIAWLVVGAFLGGVAIGIAGALGANAKVICERVRATDCAAKCPCVCEVSNEQ